MVSTNMHKKAMTWASKVYLRVHELVPGQGTQQDQRRTVDRRAATEAVQPFQIPEQNEREVLHCRAGERHGILSRG